YAEIVRDKFTLRQLAQLGSDLLRKAYEPTGTVEEMLGEAERAVLCLAERRVTYESTSAEVLMRDFICRVDDLKTHGKRRGLLTGFLDLASLTSGLHKGELIVVAARPSIGKTSLATCITANVAIDEKVPVFFVSLEQSKEELTDRMVCSEAYVDS